jgi:4,5-DOPA dioxygenase extradiol
MTPSLFVAHGSPMLAVEQNEYTQFLNRLGQEMKRPTGIVLFSAHWEQDVQAVSDMVEYSTIYDFGGFPEALYRIQYPARGDARLVEQITKLLRDHQVPFRLDQRRGLDHGAWVVLRLLYPNADVPVVAMSVNPALEPEEQYNIGKALSALREQDVLIIASGGTVHNLATMRMGDDADAWAVEFDDWLHEHLVRWDLDSLFAYDSLAPNARLAVPPFGREHFIPIFYAMGAADNHRVAKLLHRSYRYGSLSHSVWQFG